MDIYAIRFKIIFLVIKSETELCSSELKSNRFIKRKGKKAHTHGSACISGREKSYIWRAGKSRTWGPR